MIGEDRSVVNTKCAATAQRIYVQDRDHAIQHSILPFATTLIAR